MEHAMTILRRSRYNPARGGHAPGDVREAFLEGIKALLDWQAGEPEPMVELRDRAMPVSTVAGLLWSCADTLPRDTRATLEDLGVELPGYVSYAAAARRLKPWITGR
jgi:hypothetical protein